MPFKIVRNDITKMKTDAIVNTANAWPTVGTGCDCAVYEAAGFETLLDYRRKYVGYVPEGEVFVTPGFGLPARYIIHAVSPLYVPGMGCNSDEGLSIRREFSAGRNQMSDGHEGHAAGTGLAADNLPPARSDGRESPEALLRRCYRKSLALAEKIGVRSLAFPLISTGGFGYPKEEGMRIAVDEIHAFLLTSNMQIYLVVFDEHATRMGRSLYPDLEAYIDANYVAEKTAEEYRYGEDVVPGAGWEEGEEKAAGQRRYGREPQRRRLFGQGGEDEWSTAPFKPAAQSKPTAPFKPTESADQTTLLGPHRPAEKGKPAGRKAGKTGILGGFLRRSEKKEASRKECGTSAPFREDYPDEAVKANASAAPGLFSQEVMEACAAPEASLDSDAAIEEMERRLAERMEHLADSFPQYLLYLIEKKGMENAEVYKRAIVDKKVFSKIKNNPGYHPQKLTALCLCVGAKLNMDESRDLLSRAGYAFSPCDKTDIIFSYFIENRIYDMIELDIQLEEYGLPCIIA